MRWRVAGVLAILALGGCTSDAEHGAALLASATDAAQERRAFRAIWEQTPRPVFYFRDEYGREPTGTGWELKVQMVRFEWKRGTKTEAVVEHRLIDHKNLFVLQMDK